MHADTVGAVPGRGVWYDIGCGPGLIPGIASERGFDATGFDINPESIALAKKLYPKARFSHKYLEAVLATPDEKPNVISMSSLLFVLPEKAEALNGAWKLLREGGHLVIIETTGTMNLRNVVEYSIKQGSFSFALCLWGFARSGRTVEGVITEWARKKNYVAVQNHLGGMVRGWVIRK